MKSLAVVPKIKTKLQKQQRRWAIQAQSGDRIAEARLIESVRPWVIRKTAAYAKFCGIEAEELQCIVWSVFPGALKYYKAKSGGFLNFFIVAATRALSKYARKETVRSERHRGFSSPDLIPDRPESEQGDLQEVMAKVGPIDRKLIESEVRLHGRAERFSDICRRLGISCHRAKLRYSAAINRLRQQLGTSHE